LLSTQSSLHFLSPLSLSGTEIKEQAVDGPLLSTSPPDLLSRGDGMTLSLPTAPANRTHRDSTAAPPPARLPPAETRCGGVLTDLEGSFSSPNHPGPYPSNSLCVWVIQVQTLMKLLSFSSLLFCSFCLSLCRFCGNVAPPTVNTNSSTVWVTFRSDGSIAGSGFTAQYRAILPEHKTCSREEFMCDSGRCLLPVSVCDGHPNCHDQTDEANCSHKHNGESRQKPCLALNRYIVGQLCTWRISVEKSHVITLSFRNFSLETQDVCEFDYVEVHDSAHLFLFCLIHLCLRFCGTTFPPDLTSSGPQMTVVFVADEGVADSGFNATYQAVSLTESKFYCECLHQQWLCDGWNDCSDGADEQGSTSCESIEVEMCQGLSYNLTSFPNIWLSIADQREAAALLRQYQVLKELACYEPLQRLVCGMFLPQCSPQGGILQPCRSVCSSAEQQCSQALDLFSFSWPFNCHLLPDSQDPMECSSP
uniref:Membrane frizzled-related protein n=1 Tax=Myripristis murdjan TaxID=586833 RepID=A0A667XZB4_9TELE